MGNDSLIHLKFEYMEVLESKRDLLYSEKETLLLERIMKNYRALRMEEMKLRIKLQKKIMDAASSLRKLQKLFPKVAMPDAFEREEKEIEETQEILKKSRGLKNARKEEPTGIESQLQEIQRKLSAIHG